MTDTEARALLRRLDEAWRDGGEASHSFEVLTQVLREARALLAEPEKQRWQSDLTVDQHLLCDSNRAGKVTIDPTLLSPPTPRSRAEAEAMVEAHCHAIREHGVHFTEETRVARDKAHAALLRALTGEGT